MNDSFVFHKQWHDVLQGFSTELRREVYEIIIDYAITGEMPFIENQAAEMAFEFIKERLNSDRVKYEKRSQAGKIGNEKRWGKKSQTIAKNRKESQTIAKNRLSVSDTESVSVTDTDTDTESVNIEKKNTQKKSIRFVKPSIEEVADYCEERHNGINAEKFCDFYEAKGWKIGNNPMKDWRAAVRTWERKNKKQNQNEEVSQQAAHNDEPCMVIPKSEREGLQRYMEERGAKVELSVSDYARIKMMCHGKKKAIEAVIGEICGWEKEPEDIMWSVQYMLDNQYHELLWD